MNVIQAMASRRGAIRAAVSTALGSLLMARRGDATATESAEIREAPGEATDDVIPSEPEPIQIIVQEMPEENGWVRVIRRWEPGTHSRCRHCAECLALVGNDGQAVCIVNQWPRPEWGPFPG